MNALSFIRNAISRRITQLENECYLITQQMQFFAYTNSHEVDFLLLNYQLDNSVCKMYKLYLSEIQKLYMDVCPMKRAISCHLFVMKNFPLNSLLNEIIGHQNALQELCNIDLKRSVDDLVGYINVVFPFDVILPKIALDMKLFSKLLKIAIQYNIETHKQSISAIYNLIKNNGLDKYMNIMAKKYC